MKKNMDLIADVEILKDRRIIKKDREIAEKTGFSKSVVSNYLSGRIEASQNFKDKFYEVFNEHLIENKVSKEEPKGNIIYVPLYAYGGFLGGYRNIVFIDQLEHFRLPGVTGEHYAFEIGGYSMMRPGHELSATPGDVAISRMEEDFKHMVKGKGYILQTIDGILYKIFDKIHNEKAYFNSLNEDYEGHSLSLKEIKRVYFVNFILKKTH